MYDTASELYNELLETYILMNAIIYHMQKEKH